MNQTARDVQARARKLMQARGREHMDRTGIDYRLMSIALWADGYQNAPRMIADYRMRTRRLATLREFMARINSVTYGEPIVSLPEAWRELDGIAQKEGL